MERKDKLGVHRNVYFFIIVTGDKRDQGTAFHPVYRYNL